MKILICVAKKINIDGYTAGILFKAEVFNLDEVNKSKGTVNRLT